MNQAVVVFLDRKLVDSPSWYGMFLKHGFLHCFVLIEDNQQWIKLEGSRGMIFVKYLGEITDVLNHYRDQGATVVSTTVSSATSRLPLISRNCVGLTKALLGIRSLAITPWQLYKALTRNLR